MPFDPVQTALQINQSVSAMALLNSSCQGLIETSITPSTSPWYPVLDKELGTVENLVVGWRQSGFLYFQQQIVQQVGSCGQAFLKAQPRIDGQFVELEQNFTQALLQKIANELTKLEDPVNGMIVAIAAYGARLKIFETALEAPAQAMAQTIAQVQAQEQDIAAEIAQINSQLATLQQQLQTDRAAIAKAEAKRTSGIFETIFGVLLAPFTGGASLVLAGFGVASLVEAQAEVSHLEDEISGYQQQIVGDTAHLTTDQQQVATLQGLLVSTNVASSDIAQLFSALDALRITWGVLLGELQNSAATVAKAESYENALVAKVFFDAACNAWQQILDLTGGLAGMDPPTPTMVTVG